MSSSTGFLSFLNPARVRFFEEKNAEKALQLVQPYLWKRGISDVERVAARELAALIYRHLERYADAVKVYAEIRQYYLAGYCEMLQGNLSLAAQYWSQVAQERSNHWCITLFGLITRGLSSQPTLLQIRNNLEADVASLVRSGQGGFLENLLSYGELLSQFNLEAYKFMGRGLLNTDQAQRSGAFFLKGQKVLPSDPEIYFHLGQYSHAIGRLVDARIFLNQAILIAPTYGPAKRLLDQLNEKETGSIS